ncbi:MAG: hypothetical protein AAGF92_20610 [Myxococcota bacterium]
MAEDEVPSVAPPSSGAFDFDEGSITALLDTFVETHTADRPPQSSHPPDPNDTGAQAAQRTVFQHAPRHESLPLVGNDADAQRRRIVLLSALADRSAGSARARLLAGAAELHDQLGETDAAIAAYRLALESDARDVVSLRGLRHHALRARDWAGAAECLQREASLSLTPEERAAAFALLAVVHLRRTGDVAGAERAARESVALAPNDFTAHLAVANACLARGDLRGAGSAIASASECWAEPQAQTVMLQHAGSLMEQSGDLEVARTLYERAAELDATSLTAHAGLIRSSHALEDFENCVEALEQLADRTEDSRLQQALRRAAAALIAGPLCDGPRALETLAEHEDPTSQWTRAEIATRHGSLALAADLLQQDAKPRQNAIAAARAERLHAEARTGALPTTEVDGEHPLSSYRRLVRRLRGEDDGSELRLVLDAMHVAPDGAPADIVGADKAALLGDGAAMVASLERAVGRASDSLGSVLALAEVAGDVSVGGRRHALERGKEHGGRDPILCRAMAMESHQGDDEVAAQWREEAVSSTGSPAAFALMMAARHHLRAGADADAHHALQRALEERLDYPPAMWALEDGPFAPETRREAAAAQASLGGPLAAASWLRASMWSADPGDRLDQAKTALEIGAPDPLLIEWAAHASGYHSEATATLLEATEYEPRKTKILRCAAALLGGGFPGHAARHLRGLEDDDRGPYVDTMLEEAEIQASEFARVADSMMRRARGAHDEASELGALAAMASVDRLARRDMQSARLSLQSIAEARPRHLPTARALEWDALRERDGERIVSSARRTLESLDPETPSRAARRRLMVEVWNADEDILTSGVDRLLRGIADEVDPDPGLARRLLGLAYAERQDETALRALASLQAHLGTNLERGALSLERAHLLHRMGDPERALAILADAGEHPLAVELEARLLHAASRWEEATETYGRAAELAKDAKRSASLWREAGVILEERLEDVDGAIDLFVAASEADITYEDVYRRLVSIYQRAGRHSEAEALTCRRIDAGDDTPNLVALLLEQAAQRRGRGNLDAVVESLNECLELDPQHFAALSELVETHRARQDWQGATEALIRIARLRRSTEEQVSAFSQLAEVYDLHLGDQARAEAALRQVLKLAPARTETLDHMARVLSVQGKAKEAARVLDDLVGRTEQDDRQVDFRIRLAAAIESAGHARQGEAYLEQLRTERPTDIDVIFALADHFDRQGSPAASAMHLNRALVDLRDAIDDRPQDEKLWSTLVRVLARRHGDGAASCAASTALALGFPPTPFDGSATEGRAARGNQETSPSPEVDRVVAPRALRPNALRLLGLCEQGFDRVITSPAKAWKLKRTPSKLRGLVDEAAAAAKRLGVSEPKLRFVSGASTVCMPLSGDPPTLLVGEALAENTTPAERAFLFVRALKAAEARLAPLLGATPEAIDAVLLALFGNHEASRAGRAPPSDAADIRKKLLKSVPRRQRDEVEGLVLELRGDVDFSASAVPLAIAELGSRVALVMTGDVPSAINALLKAAGESIPSAPTARLALIRETPEAWALVRFALSDAHFEARAQAGVDP